MPRRPVGALLLPGLDGTGQLFERFVAVAPERFAPRVVGFPPDRPLDYEALRDRVGQEVPFSGPFVLIAESFSTPLAVLVAQDMPLGLAAVVLVAGFARPPVSRGWRLLPWSTLFRLPAPQGLLEHYLTGSADGRLIDPLRRALSQVRPNVLAGRVRSLLDCDTREQLARSRVPLLYLRGQHDRLISSRSWQEIHEARPDAVRVDLPTPHLVLQHAPEAAWEAIANFVDDRNAA